MTAIGVFLSVTTSSVVFEPLQVPTLFVEQGYSPEITTTRILDEVARINELSTTTKLLIQRTKTIRTAMEFALKEKSYWA